MENAKQLTDRDILERISHNDPNKRIFITPLIDLDEQLGPAGLDLRLGPSFRVTETSGYTHLDPLISESGEGRGGTIKIIERANLDDPFVFHPNKLVIGETLEFISLPPDIAGELKGRSTWGREGFLVHLTADRIQPGSKNIITFELLNAGPVPVELYVGMRISQIVFNCLGEDTLRNYETKQGAKYARSLRAGKGSFWDEKEVIMLKKYFKR